MTIQCGVLTPQTFTLFGTNFPVFPLTPIVWVRAPGADPVAAPIVSSSSLEIVGTFVFAACGVYTFTIDDGTGCLSGTLELDLTLTGATGAVPGTLPAATTSPTCPPLCVDLTLGDLRRDVQRRLGDESGAVWSDDEVDGYLREAYRTLATQLPVFWDQVYLENLPRGFSYTQPWEQAEADRVGGFNYGVANFTAEFERRAGASLQFDERQRIGPANHTSPFEATDGLIGRAHASPAIPATAELSKRLTALDRVSWDNRGIDALEPRSHSRIDARYEITAGEVYGFMWQKDGVRTLRKVRVPAAQAATVTVNGAWGLLRTPADLSTVTVIGTWGIARRIPGQHPLGPERFGAPRRPYLEGKNVRVEYFRQGRVFATEDTVCELPTRYALYLRDFTQARCLSRPGPGYDQTLAEHFSQRWQRGLARIERRTQIVDPEHVTVMGGDAVPSVTRPPRPSLPWAYGSRVR